MGKCEVYTESCPSWDKHKDDIVPQGWYPKSRRMSAALFRVNVSKSAYLLMCGSCKGTYLKKHPHLQEFMRT